MMFVTLFVIWSVQVGDLILCKTLLKISVKSPSFLPHGMLFVLFSKRESKALCKMWTDIQGQTQTLEKIRRQLSARYRVRLIQQREGRRQRKYEAESSNLDSLLMKRLQKEIVFKYIYSLYIPCSF